MKQFTKLIDPQPAEWGLADKRPNCQPLREVIHQVLRLPVQKMNKNGVPRTTLA